MLNIIYFKAKKNLNKIQAFSIGCTMFNLTQGLINIVRLVELLSIKKQR